MLLFLSIFYLFPSFSPFMPFLPPSFLFFPNSPLSATIYLELVQVLVVTASIGNGNWVFTNQQVSTQLQQPHIQAVLDQLVSIKASTINSEHLHHHSLQKWQPFLVRPNFYLTGLFKELNMVGAELKLVQKEQDQLVSNFQAKEVDYLVNIQVYFEEYQQEEVNQVLLLIQLVLFIIVNFVVTTIDIMDYFNQLGQLGRHSICARQYERTLFDRQFL